MQRRCDQCLRNSAAAAASAPGLPQCLVPTYLYAVPCTTPGLFNLTTLAGVPISSPATYGGPGMYLSNSGVCSDSGLRKAGGACSFWILPLLPAPQGSKMLCFTVPLRITLRTFVFPAFVTLLACYAAWAAITGLLACLTGPFTRCGRVAARWRRRPLLMLLLLLLRGLQRHWRPVEQPDPRGPVLECAHQADARR